ncbi:uncharacterized protein TNCV_2343021 [Trichonephila clavipes]|nr:uncharacterized protein TNCV_2343021 [Trichonephila clavipes]
MSEVGVLYKYHYIIDPIPLCGLFMCESTFALATPKPVTEVLTKYNYIVAHLPPIRYVLMHPDATDQRTNKKWTYKLCRGISSQEIQNLLSGEELGSQKPSKLLCHMK